MNFENYEDEKIVDLAQKGDENAQEYIIRKYKGLVRSKSRLYFIAGGDGDDLVQEGMIGVFKAIKDYDPQKDAAFKTFVELCINRQIIKAVEKASRQKHMPLNNSIVFSGGSFGENHEEAEEPVYLSVAAGEEEQPEKMLMAKEMADEISEDKKGIFSKLEKQVLKEYLKGDNYVEIAETLGKNSKTIDNALQRIKRKVRAYFSD